MGAIAAKIAPALVDVNSTFGYERARGAGTGIVLTSTGEILTNNHVIDGATQIRVTDVGNHRTYAAKVVGYDPIHDIAVLQLQGASGLQTAQIGDSSRTVVGESVVAVGNAGGTGGTPRSSGGSVTALDRSITASDQLDGVSEQLTGMIEVNADLQSGDSGGSLVNTAGQVIGMDSAAAAGFSFQSSVSQGYAIPINRAIATARLIESGRGSSVVHIGPTALLGVLISPSANQGAAGGNSGGFGGSTTTGAMVSGVVTGGAAQQAGLAAGDMITSLGHNAVTSSTSVSDLLILYHPGDKVQVGWTDTSGQPHTATLDLGAGPPA